MRWITNLLRRTSIAFRVGAIAALLLTALVITNGFVIRQLEASAQRVITATRLFDALEAAGGASRAFGDLRYWLTDVAVSMLTMSERNAKQARAELDTYLGQLEASDPELAKEIATEADAYMEKAREAVDAYTDNNRVIGNTLLAEARQHSSVVQDRLASLRARLHKEAWAARDLAVEEAGQATRVAISTVIAVVVLGLLLVFTIFRSIVRPLRELNTAMSGMINGRQGVTVPPLGDDEFGRMAQTMNLLKSSNSERERLQLESEKQRRTIVTAIETISEGFVLFDADDRLVIANSNYERLYPGLADVIVPGRTFREILAAAVERGITEPTGSNTEQWIDHRMALHLNPGEPFERELPDEKWVRISEKRAPFGGIVGIYSDITELKRRQVELEEAKREAENANQAKSDFLANMSHELRTPLNAVIGYSEMLIDDVDGLDHNEVVADLGKIRMAGRHLLGLINDVLDFSKIEAGKMEVLAETIDVGELLSEVESTIAPLASKNNNMLEIKADADLGTMRSDLTKLRQSLFNLLSNACKFTKDGVVTLAVERLAGPTGDLMRFTVSDNGIGISRNQLDRLFQAFGQGDVSTSRNFGGTGLGLAITQHFCRLLGGDIVVDSELGKGSTFTMTVLAELAPEQEDADMARATPKGASGTTILVIDDEKVVRKMIGNALMEQGYRVINAQGGREGLKLAREHRPDAIILDVIMPDIDGWSVLRSLKSDSNLADIPVILITVLGDRDLGMALGAAEYLSKPISPSDLARVLARIRRQNVTADVLVVDDDEHTRHLLRRMLDGEGWTVHEAVDGADGLAKLAEAKPAAVLLDLMMPRIDGFEMLRTMRENPEWHDVPVVIITSKDLSRSELEWLRGNTMKVFQKGAYRVTELISSLRGMVEAAQRLRLLADAD